MKIVIIGGGIGGMTTAILLKNAGFNICICEKETDIPARGNAFLMHAEGLDIIESLNPSPNKLLLPGKMIDSFMLKRPDDTTVKYQKLNPWQCIKRSDLIAFLYSGLSLSIFILKFFFNIKCFAIY
jgi:2-polyprenyl-6-methoxyphenol hydroxylase-like FAD-dependent oxidoreductase